ATVTSVQGRKLGWRSLSPSENAPGHSWHGSLGACSPLPRAREKVWWAVRGRIQILGVLPGVGKHCSFQSVLAWYWGGTLCVDVGRQRTLSARSLLRGE